MPRNSIVTEPDHRPHDLLWVNDASALIPVDALPAWATAAWLSVAPAVVRRAPIRSNDRVPVGLRGATRSERCAAHAAAAGVIRKVTPEDIARCVSVRPWLHDSVLPCLRALARLAPALDAQALTWGVTGSVGFTLASRLDVLRIESDLDLLVRAPSPADADTLRGVAELVCAVECRVDVQVETTRGAFALDEWLRTGGPVLLKTAHGPGLCDNPWQGVDLNVDSPLLA